MYRVQLSGGQYQPDAEVGLHYQIHRGIGVHHAAAIRRGEPLRVNIFVGGPPAMTVAAVMPLPEGMSELGFAGALGGRRVPMIRRPGRLPIYAEADFCITGTSIRTAACPRDRSAITWAITAWRMIFPCCGSSACIIGRIAIWPFTVVGRPPQEDTMFGEFIHELTGPIVPTLVPGVRAVHAVDAAGVHPLLLAIGSERYVPYEQRRRPQELLTQANALLGQGQMSLAKYLLIVAGEDDPQLDIHDVGKFLGHALARVDWRRDLHFQTCTTIDTLDYSGSGTERRLETGDRRGGTGGSDAADEIAGRFAVSAAATAAGDARRAFRNPRLCLPGVLAIAGPKVSADGGNSGPPRFERFCTAFAPDDAINRFPLVVIVDDSEFAASVARQFSVGDIHAQQSGGGCLRHRRIYRSRSIGAAAARW